VQVPVALVIVNVAPTFEQTPPLENETAKPELDVAATVKLELNAALPGALVVTVIDWLAFDAATVRATLVAAL
jgi:hypothetical protein